MAARIYRPLKVIAFNANGIWKQFYGLSKQLHIEHREVALLSETHLKPLRGSLLQIIALVGLPASPEEKAFRITM
jgi:hypothetical protein